MQQRALFFEGNRFFRARKNVELIHNQLCDDIEEVGASHVVQVVTYAAIVVKQQAC